jgi:hypothetical protein
VYDHLVERRLIVAVPDLIFQSRIEAAAVARGLVVVAAASDQQAEEAIGRGAAGLVVDLQAAGFAPRRVIEAARAARVPALAFGRHTDAAALRAAREAGATAVPRSQLAEELAELLGKLVGDAGAAASGA